MIDPPPTFVSIVNTNMVQVITDLEVKTRSAPVHTLFLSTAVSSWVILFIVTVSLSQSHHYILVSKTSSKDCLKVLDLKLIWLKMQQ